MQQMSSRFSVLVAQRCALAVMCCVAAACGDSKAADAPVPPPAAPVEVKPAAALLEDAEALAAMPTGAAPLPQALLLAWSQACKFAWDRGSIEDRAKAGFGAEELERFVTGESKLPVFVLSTLAKFRRISA